MSQRLRHKIGWIGINLIVVSLALVSIVSVIEPWPDILPVPRIAGEATLGIVFFSWIIIWFVVRGWYGGWRWRQVGKAAGLTPENSAFMKTPDLVGQVDGREVRAASEPKAQTVVTELATEPTDGAIVGDLGTQSIREVVRQPDYENGDLAALASEPELAETLLTGRSGEALASAECDLVVFAGKVPDEFRAWFREDDVKNSTTEWDVFDEQSGAGKGVMRKFINNVNTGDDQTVACVKPYDWDASGQELRERAEAVVAVADAFEASQFVAGDTERT